MSEATTRFSAAGCTVGRDPEITLRREAPGEAPHLRVEVGRVRMTLRDLTRRRDPVRDVTRYEGAARLEGRPASVTILVNCGAAQPYFELTATTLSEFGRERVTIPITDRKSVV